MYIDEITNGIVIDHIRAGKSMEIYNLLKLGLLDCSVAIIKNVQSKKMGKKDIIKIDDMLDVDIDALGYIDHGITVNVIKNGKMAEKKHLSLPAVLKNIVKCTNPRCITSTENEIDHIFRLTDRENKVYRCIYCEMKAK